MNNTLITLDEVKSMTTLSRSTLYQLMADGDFPKSIPITGKRVAWLQREVQAWIDARINTKLQISTHHNPVRRAENEKRNAREVFADSKELAGALVSIADKGLLTPGDAYYLKESAVSLIGMYGELPR